MFIFKRNFYLMLLGGLILALLWSVEVQAQPVLSDIQGNWAQKPIQAMVDKGVLNGYPDGAFKPDQPVTRAELAKIVAKTFAYSADQAGGFPDINGHWAQSYINEVAAQKIMNAYSDKTFKPEGNVSRAQMVTMLMRIINMARSEEHYGENWPASFQDVPSNHWAFRYVELAKKLNLLPAGYQNNFGPDQAVTRAEAVWMVNAMNNLEITKGKISQVDSNTGLVNVHASNGDPKLAMVTPDTIVLRNNVTSSIDALLNNDTITVIAVPSGDVKLVKTFGEVTKNDLLSRISSFTKGKLSNDQIAALVSGDWNTVKDDLKGELYNKMVDMGLTPAESETIMNQDWNYLDSLSKDRLSQAISKQVGISQEFSQALLDRDMTKIKEYGRIELATAALSRLLGNASQGNDGSNTDNNSY